MGRREAMENTSRPPLSDVNCPFGGAHDREATTGAGGHVP